MASPRQPDRRGFLASSALGAFGLATGAFGWAPESTFSPKSVEPPRPVQPIDGPVRLAVVGVRGRGWEHVNAFARHPRCRIVALCDVDSKVLAQRAAECAQGARNRPGFEVSTTGDVRTLLERDDIDAVSIATPNHTHAMIACWALDAGKHVYVEKPVSHVLDEGARIVDAAERNRRLCATGTQARSSLALRSAIEFLRSGRLGEIAGARGLCYKPRRSIGKVSGVQFPPPTVDYDRWLGPVEYSPLRRANLHYDWHWDLHTGNGDLGNQGIHQMDIARWALGWSDLPDKTVSVGGRVGYDDDGNTPNTQVVFFRRGSATLVFEVRGLPRDKAEQSGAWEMDRMDGLSIGNVVYGEHGSVRISSSYDWAAHYDLDGKLATEWKGGGDHFANFIDAVLAGDPALLNAPIHEGHLSSAYCHLGLVSHRLGTRSSKREVLGSIGPEPVAAEACERMYAHLRDNGIDPDTDSLTLGRTLLQPLGADAAALARRDCRPPYRF